MFQVSKSNTRGLWVDLRWHKIHGFPLLRKQIRRELFVSTTALCAVDSSVTFYALLITAIIFAPNPIQFQVLPTWRLAYVSVCLCVVRLCIFVSLVWIILWQPILLIILQFYWWMLCICLQLILKFSSCLFIPRFLCPCCDLSFNLILHFSFFKGKIREFEFALMYCIQSLQR